jgi:hypothetical protein
LLQNLDWCCHQIEAVLMKLRSFGAEESFRLSELLLSRMARQERDIRDHIQGLTTILEIFLHLPHVREHRISLGMPWSYVMKPMEPDLSFMAKDLMSDNGM